MGFNGVDRVTESRAGGDGKLVAGSGRSLGNESTKVYGKIGDLEGKRDETVYVLKTGTNAIAVRVKLALESLADGISENIGIRVFTATSHVKVTHVNAIGVGSKIIGPNVRSKKKERKKRKEKKEV